MTLREEDHRYFSTDGYEWKSCSAVLKNLEEPFYAKAVALRCANGNAAKARALQQEWDEIREDACDYGHDIHSAMERFIKEGVYDSELGEMQERLYKEVMMGYDQICSERTLYMQWPNPDNPSELKRYAGQSDKIFVRKGRNVIDILDYKTNKRNGIRFDSSYVDKKTGLTMPGKKFLLEPLSHLEKCEYNKYAIQLSDYGLMAETTYGVNIGKMALVYIYKDSKDRWDYSVYPVPYLKYEAMALYNYDVRLKQMDVKSPF